jgi:hypothetical protein
MLALTVVYREEYKMSPKFLRNSPEALFRQISQKQYATGFTIADRPIAKCITSENAGNNGFIRTAILREFPGVDAEELLARTTMYLFEASDENKGKCCIVYDRP